MNKVIQIMVVDDHQIVIDGIKAMLSHTDQVRIIGQAHNGKEALTAIKILSPDLILMDINMPEMGGIEACEIISKNYPDLKILILSMISEQSLVHKALTKGAHGYVLKNEGRDELIDAIVTVFQGGKYISEVIKNRRSKWSKPSAPVISRREKQVLRLIVNECTTKEIAQKLFITPHTVDAHRKNLLMKLNVRNTAGLVRVALEQRLVAQ